MRVQKCTPSLVLQSVVGHFASKWWVLARMRTANREKPLPHKLCSSTSSLCGCPASSTFI